MPGMCVAVCAASLASLALLTALYYSLLSSRSLRAAWRRGRLLLAATVASMLAVGMLAAPAGLDTFTLALPLVVVTQLVVAQFFDRRIVGEALYGFEGRVYRVGIIESSAVTAFAVAVRGRVYASTGLYQALPPDEAAAVVAHEVGHWESLRPVPAAVALAAVAVGAAQGAEAAVALAMGGCVPGALAVGLATAAAWALYNWAWEHLADLHSLRVAGFSAYAALARITGAVPAPPPSPPGLVAEVFRSLRPRRSPTGAGLLVNPHPPPALRLWLLGRLLPRSEENTR